MLKTQCRLYERTQKISVEPRNGLISLLDQTFPRINEILPAHYCTKRGHYKWVDVSKRFWHKDCVKKLSESAFTNTCQKWCKKEGYRFSRIEAEKIYCAAQNTVATFPQNESTKTLIVQVVPRTTRSIPSWTRSGQRGNISMCTRLPARQSSCGSITPESRNICLRWKRNKRLPHKFGGKFYLA